MVGVSTPSVANRARLIAAEAPVVSAHFLGGTPVLTLSEEALLFAPAEGEATRVAVHDGAILASLGDGERILTAGDDGKVTATLADKSTTTIATDPKGRWIDHLAIGPDGAVAWSAGKDAYVATRKGAPRQIEAASTVGGLAFAPKGLRLAIAHYNGVTLWFPNAAEAKPEQLEWKGSHLDVAFSPDGRFLVTTMQEAAMHGWRLVDNKHMRMSGYSAKVRSISWSADGKELATSGANQLVLWSFQGKDGPMGREPRVFAPAENRITVVACHPKQEVVAVGYEDGMILLVRMTDGAEILARRPDGGVTSALAWHPAGTGLVFGTEDGAAGVIDLT